MIPKVIHYCWFGRNPLPEEAVKCIDSWKRFLPDYEIKEWNEDNFDLDCCDYVRQAASVNKWAFVSDFARFKILHENGGLYFDIDVEIVKQLTDIISGGNFMGLEPPISHGEPFLINPGLCVGAQKGDAILEEIMSGYQKEQYILEDGSLNTKTVLHYTTYVFRKYGFENRNQLQQIGTWSIYPTDYFCPMNYATGKTTLTDNTRSIHHYNMSWKSDYEIFMKKWERSFNSALGARNGRKLYRLVSLPVRAVHKLFVKISKRG